MWPSLNKKIRELYSQAEKLTHEDIWFLPLWAGTFPGGQLASFAATGNYVQNICRYLHYFNREQIIVIDLVSDIANATSVPGTLHRLIDHVSKAPSLIQTEKDFQNIGRIKLKADLKNNVSTLHTKANAGLRLPSDQEPTDVVLHYLEGEYASSNEELFALLGKRFEWHTSATLRSAKKNK